MFVVWQAVLPTDLAPPLTSVLSRVSDVRARQFWDPQHLVAARLTSDAAPPQPEPDCCVRNGVLWDLAAVYPKGARWDERAPPAVVFNGTVLDAADAIAAAIRQGR